MAQPELSPGGQRLHSEKDVRRLALLKQLTDLGHAIGSLARLDMQALEQVASTHASVSAGRSAVDRPQAPHSPAASWRIAVVGTSLAARLRRPTLLRRLSRSLEVNGPYRDMAEAAANLQANPVDLLLCHEPRLHSSWLARSQADAPTLAVASKAVLYRFASEPTCAALAAAGTFLLREPQHDTVLGQWLQSVLQALPHTPTRGLQGSPSTSSMPARRWDDAALADFARLSSSIACECPSHVAELLMQLAHFEAYSAECQHRNAGDAELHAYLQYVAADSRRRFEAALEYVALHEGLILPAS